MALDPKKLSADQHHAGVGPGASGTSHRRNSRDSAPLCPAGHLPHEGGDHPGWTSVVAHFQGLDKRRLRDVDLAELAHALLALFLLVEEFAFARDVAAVAFGRDVLAQRRNGLAGDDLAADGGLDRDLEEVVGDQLLQLLAHDAAALFGGRAVDQHGERVDRLLVDQDRHLDQVALAVVGEVVVEGGIALGDRLQPVVEVEDDLVERQVVLQHGALADIGEVDLDAAAVLAEFQDRAEIVVGRQDRGADPRLLDGEDLHDVGHVGRVVQLLLGAVAQVQAIDDRRRGGDEVEVELALQPLLDDLEVEQAEEAAAEAEAEGGRGLHLVGEAGVVEAQLAHGGAQFLELGGVDREKAAEDDGLRRLEARQRVRGRALVLGDRVADARVGHFLDRAGEEAELARAELVDGEHLWREDAGALDEVFCVGLHHADGLALLQAPVDDAHQHDDAEIGVVPAIDQHGLERGVDVALARRRQLVDDGLQHVGDADAGLGRDEHGVRRVDADDFLDLLADALRLGGGKVDLVQDHDDLVVGVDGLVDVGQRLRLDALRGVDDEQRALAGAERARDLVGEVDMAGRVDQVEDVVLAIVGAVVEAHGLRLDGDAALLLDVHVVEHLLGHLAQFQPAGGLDQPVGERRLAMVDMGDDGEIADVGERCGHARVLAGRQAQDKPLGLGVPCGMRAKVAARDYSAAMAAGTGRTALPAEKMRRTKLR